MTRLLVPLALSTALVLGGCGQREPSDVATADPATATARGHSTSPSASPSASPSGGASETDEPRVPASLRWSAQTVAGDRFDAVALVGQPAVLWFWAPWCPTCRSQIPQVRDLAERFEGRARVVGVGGLDDTEAIAGFAEDVPGVTHLTDPEGIVWRQFGVVEQSSFVLLDEDGTQVFTAGYGGASDLGDRVAALLG